MDSNSKLHVIFGAGPLGMAVMRELVARGASSNGTRIRMVNRSGKAGVPAGVEVLPGDASRPEDARRLAQGAAVVYQCSNPPYNRWPELFPALQAGILEGAAASGAKLVVAENLYMYGEVNGPLTEDLPYTAITRKGQVRARMAEALFAAHRSGKVRMAIARAADFYGPGVLGSAMGDRVFYPMLAGKAASVAGDIDAPHSYTFIDDFAKALVELGERDEALGQAWHVPSAETLSTRQFLALAFELAGLPPKISVMGRLMMTLGGLFIPAAREMVEMLYEFEKPFIVDSRKYEQAFGIHGTPLRDALSKTLDWYKIHPQAQ